ncbi:MAG: type II secretion system protein GspG [Bdellovibrionota bacterium]
MTSQSSFSYAFNSSSKLRAFTLIEVLIAIALMSVLTTIALSTMGNVVDDARFSQTSREMEQIRNALVGETQRLETGLRKNYGDLGDVGALPTTSQGLDVLFSEGLAVAAGVSLWSVYGSYGIGAGWKGPYLANTIDQDFSRDAWGNLYVYTNPTGVNATLISYGADGVSGGTGFNQDIEISIPTEVIRGRLLGYVVQAQGDVVGADQVPYSSNAYVELFYANGSGGLASQGQNISAGNSGRYTFSSVPLGVGAIKVYIPNSTSPTQTIGPSIVELNKAATAAVPLAQDTSTIYGTSSNCTTDENYTVSNMSIDNASRMTTFTLSLTSNYAWSGPFYYEQQSAATISYFTISNVLGGTSSYFSSTNGITKSSTGAGIAAHTNHNFSSTQLLSSGTHQFKFYYNPTGWTSSSASYMPVFYYQIGCKFFRFAPE